tara:strand:+ start:1443 stop:1859 length:417 start_codon:yes stop_codon:yes gene_type:complete
MSDNKNSTLTYDFTKNIKNIEVNTSFINGLESLLMYFILEVVEDPATIPDIFKKFESIIKGDAKDLQLTSTEVHMYTVFSLQQLFKGHAIEQKLHKEVDVDINKEEIKESLSLLLEGKKEDAFKKMGEIQETINKSLS